MKKKRFKILIILIFISSITLFSILNLIGNILYQNNNYDKAFELYSFGEKISIGYKAEFFNNEGNTFYKRKDFDKACEYYQKAYGEPTLEEILEIISYNLGNCYFRQAEKVKDTNTENTKKNLVLAIDSYTNSLKINPENKEAIENRDLARKRLDELNKNKKADPNPDSSKDKDIEEKIKDLEDKEKQNKQDYNKQKDPDPVTPKNYDKPWW